MSDFNCSIEEIEVYESSSHEERQSLSKTPKRTNIFLYILPLQILPTMRKKKKKSIFKLFHPQNKTTENLNLRIKKRLWRYLRRMSISISISTAKRTHSMSHRKNLLRISLFLRRQHRRRIGLSITNSSLIFDKQPSTWSHSTLLEPLKDCTRWKMKKTMQKLEKLKTIRHRRSQLEVKLFTEKLKNEGTGSIRLNIASLRSFFSLISSSPLFPLFIGQKKKNDKFWRMKKNIFFGDILYSTPHL